MGHIESSSSFFFFDNRPLLTRIGEMLFTIIVTIKGMKVALGRSQIQITPFPQETLPSFLKIQTDIVKDTYTMHVH